MDDDFLARARSFGGAASAYERGRPGYPVAAVRWLLPSGVRSVLDVGAGTGKFTRLLLEHAASVSAVDPSEQMLEQLRSALPSVHALVGTAEGLPAVDQSVDAVTSAQAWHWVDPDAAYREAARVLRPGGTLGLIWNLREYLDDWTLALSHIIGDPPERMEGDDAPQALPPFPPFERAEFSWTQTLDRAGLHDLVASRSVFLTASQDEQVATLQRVDELLDTHPELAGVTEYVLPYRTVCFRTRLPSAD